MVAGVLVQTVRRRETRLDTQSQYPAKRCVDTTWLPNVSLRLKACQDIKIWKLEVGQSPCTFSYDTALIDGGITKLGVIDCRVLRCDHSISKVKAKKGKGGRGG